MWIKNKKEKQNSNLFGKWSNFGFKLTISSLLVLFLVASPLVALPTKAGLFQRMDTSLQSNSQVESLKNSENLNQSQKLSSAGLRQTLVEAQTLSDNASEKLTSLETENELQTDLTVILERASALALKDNAKLASEIVNKDKIIATQEGQIKELKGNKVKKIVDFSGTYNTLNGWGVGMDVGLKYGVMTTKVGAQALVADLMNPVKLTDVNTYTFKASIGFEW